MGEILECFFPELLLFYKSNACMANRWPCCYNSPEPVGEFFEWLSLNPCCFESWLLAWQTGLLVVPTSPEQHGEIFEWFSSNSCCFVSWLFAWQTCGLAILNHPDQWVRFLCNFCLIVVYYKSNACIANRWPCCSNSPEPVGELFVWLPSNPCCF